jgi:hypothetical protein
VGCASVCRRRSASATHVSPLPARTAIIVSLIGTLSYTLRSTRDVLRTRLDAADVGSDIGTTQCSAVEAVSPRTPLGRSFASRHTLTQRAMADDRPQSPEPATEQIPGALLEQLRQVLMTHSGPTIDEDEVCQSFRAIARTAQSHGVRAEQLLTSLKRTFDALTPPHTLLSLDDQARRLSYLVTTCVHEYYAIYPEPPDGDPDGVS